MESGGVPTERSPLWSNSDRFHDLVLSFSYGGAGRQRQVRVMGFIMAGGRRPGASSGRWMSFLKWILAKINRYPCTRLTMFSLLNQQVLDCLVVVVVVVVLELLGRIPRWNLYDESGVLTRF